MFDLRQFRRPVSIRHEHGDLVIEIGPRHEPVFLFHAIFGGIFCAWMGYELVPHLARDWARKPDLETIGITCFFAPFVLVPLFLSLNGIWSYFGIETLRTNQIERKLTICTSLYHFRRVRSFKFDEPQDLRLTKFKFFGVPSVAFNAGKWRYEFATGASEEDRTRIIDALTHALGRAHAISK